MQKDSAEYQKVMNGLSQIPGLNLPIPGLSRAGYKPGAKTESSITTRSQPVLEASNPGPSVATPPVKKLPLSKSDKQLLLQSLKIFFDNHASHRTSLFESSEVLSQFEMIAERNAGNQYLEKALSALFEAARDFDLARGHLRMVIKNTAEYIKSM